MNSLKAEGSDIQIARFSEDGKQWTVQDGSKVPIGWSEGDEWFPDERVTRIVIGSLDEPEEENDAEEQGSEDKGKGYLKKLPDNLAVRYPALTHLHIWRQAQLSELPALPEGLIGLDVRFCESLIKLPLLPESLQTLDLGGCLNLRKTGDIPIGILRCYINDCIALKGVDLENCAQLIELDASNCPAMESIEDIPRGVAKLVLAGCPKLRSVEGLNAFTSLYHLNLSGCPQLTELPEIPDGIQYLALYQNEQLKHYKNQDIGPYDRGTNEEPNVAERLYVRKTFGGDLAPSAQSKLLLLGDGRVGKTTLCKALQWYSLTQEQRESGAFSNLEPKKNEPFTQKVVFGRWDTRLQLNAANAESLNQRATVAGLVEPVCDSEGMCDGAIRLWDFAGQEMYHQTHRLFASEGSVFLILWSAKDTSEEIKASRPERMSEAEWWEMNRPRSLDYWVDYVRSIRSDARIMFVCTNCTANYRPSLDAVYSRASEDDIECRYLEELVDHHADYGDFQRLLKFIREACGSEAERLGVLQPAIYSKVRNQVDELLVENVAARLDPNQTPQHLLMPMPEWKSVIDGLYGNDLEPRFIEAITGYLHDAGILYHIQDAENPSVMLDQSWGAEVIYELFALPKTDSDHCLFNVIRNGNGRFSSDALTESKVWQSVSSEAEKALLLKYIQDAGLIVKVLHRENSLRCDEDIYLATEKWLLREYQELDLEKGYFHIRDRVGDEQEYFSFEDVKIGEFDFRVLMAKMAGGFGLGALFFRNGVQIVDETSPPQWCFEVKWEPLDNFSYFGRIDVRLAAAQNLLDEYSRKIADVLLSRGSPLAGQQLARIPKADVETARRWFIQDEQAEYDMAISSNGEDHELAQVLYDRLKAEGYRVKWYKERHNAPLEKILDLMKSLALKKVLLIVGSDAYFSKDPSNFYCLFELADALLKLEQGERDHDKTFMVYKNDIDSGESLDRTNMLPRLSEALESMFQHFSQAALQETNRPLRKDMSWLAHIYSSAEGSGAVEKFNQYHGPMGKSPWISLDGDKYDFSVLIEEIQYALAKK